MTLPVWVQVLNHLRVLDLMGVGLNLFLYSWVEFAPDPHRTGFRFGFYFSPADASETKKNLKP
jgi:hypothetical protein